MVRYILTSTNFPAGNLPVIVAVLLEDAWKMGSEYAPGGHKQSVHIPLEGYGLAFRGLVHRWIAIKSRIKSAMPMMTVKNILTAL